MKNLILCIALLSIVGTAVSSTAFSRLSQLQDASFEDLTRMLQQNNNNNANNNVGTGSFSLVASLAAKTVVQALIMVGVGAFLSFFGYKIFKVTVFLSGFLVGFQAYTAFAADAQTGAVSFTGYLIAIVIGAVIGYINLFCLKVTYFILGFLTGGIAFALFLFLVFSTGHLIATLVVALASGIAAVYLFQIFIIIGTTFIGCVCTFSGLVYFTGASTTATIILSILLVLKFGVGFLKQWRDWRGDQAREALEKEKKAPLQEGYIVEMPASTNGVSTLHTQESAKGHIYDPYRPQQQQV